MLPVPPSVRAKGQEFMGAFMKAATQEMTKAARPVQQYVNVLIADVSTDVANLKGEVKQLTAAKDAAELKVKHLGTENRRLDEGKKALRQKVADAERQLKKERERRRQTTAGSQMSALQAQLARVTAENERLQAQVKDLSFQREQLRHRLSDLAPRGETVVVEPVDDSETCVASTALAVAVPESLAEIGSWAKTNLAGKLIVREKALQEAAQSRYEQPQVVYRALLLLANQYRELRLGVAKHDWVALLAQEQLTDDFCLSESASGKLRDGHTFTVEGRSYYMERHLKRGTSRDPRQCLRIYYAWDPERQVVIVGALPEHLRTNAT